MKIDFWIDVSCPYSYIAKRQIEKAMKDLNISADIVFRSFMLNHKQKTDLLMTEEEYQVKIFGRTHHEVEQMHNFLIKEARKEGLNINYDAMVVANSFNAHRLLHYAKTCEKQYELMGLLFEAYLEEGLNVDSPRVLLQRAKLVGLPIEESMKVINGDAFKKEVHRDFAQAHTKGIEGVPYFVINGNFEFSGAMGVSGFKELLTQARQ